MAYYLLRCVMISLYEDIREKSLDEGFGRLLGKYGNGVDRLQGSQEPRSLHVGDHRSPRTFDPVGRAVAVHADQQKVTQFPCLGQNVHMSDMQDVEDTVREDEGLLASARPFSKLDGLLEGKRLRHERCAVFRVTGDTFRIALPCTNLRKHGSGPAGGALNA